MKQKTLKWKIIIIEKKKHLKNKNAFFEMTQKISKNSAKHIHKWIFGYKSGKCELYKSTLKSVVRSFKLAVGDKKIRRQNKFRKINKKIVRMDLLIYKNIKLSMNYIFVDKHFFVFFGFFFLRFFFCSTKSVKIFSIKKMWQKNIDLLYLFKVVLILGVITYWIAKFKSNIHFIKAMMT